MRNARREITDKTIRALTVLETEVVSGAVKYRHRSRTRFRVHLILIPVFPAKREEVLGFSAMLKPGCEAGLFDSNPRYLLR
jgi:hypothetical protein